MKRWLTIAGCVAMAVVVAVLNGPPLLVGLCFLLAIVELKERA